MLSDKAHVWLLTNRVTWEHEIVLNGQVIQKVILLKDESDMLRPEFVALRFRFAK